MKYLLKRWGGLYNCNFVDNILYAFDPSLRDRIAILFYKFSDCLVRTLPYTTARQRKCKKREFSCSISNTNTKTTTMQAQWSRPSISALKIDASRSVQVSGVIEILHTRQHASEASLTQRCILRLFATRFHQFHGTTQEDKYTPFTYTFNTDTEASNYTFNIVRGYLSSCSN